MSHPGTAVEISIRRRLWAVVAVIVLASACGGTSSPTIGPTIVGEASSTVGFDGLQDWIDVADFVAVVTVLDEVHVDDNAGRGPEVLTYSVLNRMSVQVNRVLWSAEATVTAGSTIDMVGYGYLYRDGGKIQSPFHPHFEVGATYLVSVADFPEGLAPVTDSWVFPVDPETGAIEDGTLADGEGGERTLPAIKRGLESVVPRNVDEIESQLVVLPYSPEFRANGATPTQRYAAAVAARDAAEG